MPFLTKKELVIKPLETASVLNSILERKNGQADHKKTVFLFYNPSDQHLVRPIVNILKSLRINVYVDFIDNAFLEQKPDGITGMLKERIDKADKVIFLSTPEGSEIKDSSDNFGLNGSLKNPKKVVVFPVTRMANQWEEQVCYEKYGFISKKFALFNFPDDWMIQFPGGEKTSLKHWILTPPQSPP